jgi:histidinol-phosphate/aromatic aminotransferase/cobyric acid decarboxylase-like protein
MIITDPELAAELQRLYAEYPVASARAAAALKTEPPGHELKGETLRRFLAEEEKVAAIVRRIKEILGTTGQPWNA